MKRTVALFWKRTKKESGFTLIEMAIVLIIIGIIIGAVIKGKDIIRSGEQKKLYSTFLNAWTIAYSNYYDRTGWVLGDVNDADNGQTAGGRDGQCSNPSAANLNSQLTAVGLELPPEGPTGVTTVRTYTDSNGNFATLTVTFNFDASYGNYIGIAGIPNELGMAWDRLVDGQMDGTAGSFRYIPNSGAMGTSAAWPAATVSPLAGSVAILKLSF